MRQPTAQFAWILAPGLPGPVTQVAGLAAAAITVVVALFLTPLFEPLPDAVLGAIVIVAVAAMFKVSALRRLWRVSRADLAMALVALVGVLVFGVLPGLLVAVVVSLALVIWRASSARITRLALRGDTFVDASEHPDATEVPGILIMRPEEPVFFANADTLMARILDLVEQQPERPRAVVLDLEISASLDVPGADMLVELATQLGRRGTALHLARVHPDLAGVLERTGAVQAMAGRHRRIIDAVETAGRG